MVLKGKGVIDNAGSLKAALQSAFPELSFTSLGNPF